MITRLQVIQRIQARIGDEPIADERAPGADTHIAVYESVIDDLLSRYPWSFASATRRLPLLQATPPLQFAHYFQLPAEMIGPPRAVYAHASRVVPYDDYEVTENRLAANAPDVWATITKRAEPSVWPGYFAALADTVLMSEFALSIREDHELRERLRAAAFGDPQRQGDMGMLGDAMAADGLAAPPPEVRARVIRGMLSRYPWSFARKVVALVRSEAVPVARWKHFYVLPEDMISTPRGVYDKADQRETFTEYEYTDGFLAADAEALWMAYTAYVAPERWPGYFAALIDLGTKAETALLTKQRTLYRELYQQVYGTPSTFGEGGLFAQAMQRDTQGQPQRQVTERVGYNPLIDARFR